MPLSPGTRLGPYDVLSQIGAGGMGEVYRARDTRLKRDIAIKILPEAWARDADRRARFRREAELLATLNHPNIAAIYGVEEAGENEALLLELVEGPTLADRVASGPLPVSDALAIARQIVDALDAAHERGIIHRDLKPANIKVRDDGTVKILDFGLAKALAPDSASAVADAANSPTLTSPPMTEMGMILGTAAYMSPEQARGRTVDKRTDIWAFGVVLFEMLTGERPFERQTSAETLAAVLKDRPDLDRVPASARRLIGACLERAPDRRLRDIGDAQLLIDEDSETAVTSVRRGWLTTVGWAVALFFALTTVGVVWWGWRSPATTGNRVTFQFVPSATPATSGASAISPNGRHLAYLATGSDGVMRVWVRDMDTLADRPLTGSEIPQAAPPPFWSPDSRFIAFDAGGKLQKIDVTGGLAHTICELNTPAIGGSWSRDGTILFGTVSEGIFRVSAEGGKPSAVTEVAASRLESSHVSPVFLPDGRHFFYLRTSRSSPEHTAVFLGRLDVAPGEQSLTPILTSNASVAYAPGNPGTLLFLRDRNLMAQGFDAGRLEPVGSPALVAEQVDSYRDTATMSVSENGVLVYRGLTEQLELTWVGRDGKVVGREREQGQFGTLALSPDGTKVIVSKINPQVSAVRHLWLFDLARGLSSPLTSMQDADDAVWFSDGRSVVYRATQEGARSVFKRRWVDGTAREEELFRPEKMASPTSLAPDGSLMMFTLQDPKTGRSLWVLSLEGERRAMPFLQSGSAQAQAQFSPEPQRPPFRVAYTSHGQGRDDVFLRTFPDDGPAESVSTRGGHNPRWRADGQELFYLAADGVVTAVEIRAGRPAVGPSTPLFPLPPGFSTRDATTDRGMAPWAVASDGKRFLFATPAKSGTPTPFVVVVNWQGRN